MPARHERGSPSPARDAPGATIMLNRAALILRYKQPFVDWINSADPSPTSHTLTLAEVNQEHTVYLVEVEDEDQLAQWLERNHQELFEEELNGWYTDPALWPRDRSLETLRKWCALELHTVVRDTGTSPLADDDFG